MKHKKYHIVETVQKSNINKSKRCHKQDIILTSTETHEFYITLLLIHDVQHLVR